MFSTDCLSLPEFLFTFFLLTLHPTCKFHECGVVSCSPLNLESQRIEYSPGGAQYMFVEQMFAWGCARLYIQPMVPLHWHCHLLGPSLLNYCSRFPRICLHSCPLPSHLPPSNRVNRILMILFLSLQWLLLAFRVIFKIPNLMCQIQYCLTLATYNLFNL